jgi:hypothetical protein
VPTKTAGLDCVRAKGITTTRIGQWLPLRQRAGRLKRDDLGGFGTKLSHRCDEIESVPPTANRKHDCVAPLAEDRGFEWVRRFREGNGFPGHGVRLYLALRGLS